MIDVKFKEGALAELMAFKRNGNRAIVSKIEQLVRDIQCHRKRVSGSLRD